MNADAAVRLRRALDRLGDAALVGVYMLIGSLGVVTVFAAVSAGVAALDPDEPGPIGSVFFSRYCRLLARSIGLQCMWVAAVAVSTVDLLFGMSAGAGVLRLPVLTVGVALAVFAGVGLPFLLQALLRCNGPVLMVIRQGALVTLAAPAASVVLAGVGLLAAVIVVVVPILLPLVGGLYALTLAGIGSRQMNRIHGRQAAGTPGGPVRSVHPA